MMRKLFFAVIVAFLAYSGYWVVGSGAKKAAIEGWLEQQRARGWVADAAEVHVAGYPNRFDTRIEDLHLADPSSDWAWSAPWFQILTLSYTPNHVIAVWPPVQSFAGPGERVTLESRRIRGSVRFAPNTSLALQQAIIELDGLNFASTEGWRAGLSEGQLSVRRAPEGTAPDFGYDVDLRARTLRLPEPVKRALDPADLLPDALARLDLRATPVFDARWDRVAIEQGPPVLETLNIQNASFEWGEMEMTVTGRLDADEDGYAKGRLNVIARNWREMVEMGVNAGVLSPDLASGLRTVLAVMAEATGNSEMLDITLRFENGLAKVGPVPVGRAPRLNGGA